MTVSQLSAITEKYFYKKLVDNIYDSNPFLKRLRKNQEIVDGGTSIIVPIEYATVSASGWMDGADQLSTTENEIIQGAEYSWKHAYSSVIMKGTDELQNSGKAAVLSLLKSKIKAAEKSLADQLGTGVYSAGTVAKSIVGLAAQIATSGTIGGISATANSFWQANVDSTTTVLSLSAMDAIFEACVVDNDAPTVGLTTRTILSLYQALLSPQQRFVDKNTADAGFTNLLYRGCPIISDSYCTTAAMYFVNEDYMKLFVHKDGNFKMTPFMTPVDQRIQVARIYFDGALGSSNNSRHGKLSAITA